MKRIFEHPAESLTGKRYWRSLNELADTPEFRGWLEREFPAGAAQLEGDEVSRRSFLKLMGASMALAGGAYATNIALKLSARESSARSSARAKKRACARPCYGLRWIASARSIGISQK